MGTDSGTIVKAIAPILTDIQITSLAIGVPIVFLGLILKLKTAEEDQTKKFEAIAGIGVILL